MPDDRGPAFLASAKEILPLVRAEAAAAEARGRVSPRLIAALHERRLFRLWIPRSIGGEELALVPALEIFETIASADGAAGWTVMIGTGAGLFGGFLPVAQAREILGPAGAVIAGSGNPSGIAVETNGGYRVTGRWSYASGAHHATWFTANCIVQTAEGRPRTIAEGGRPRAAGDEPLIRAVAVPADEVVVHETWAVASLRGTGSEDFEIVDRFVPSERSFSALEDPPREPGPLYRLPFFSIAELSFASVSLGIARLALDEFRSLAQTKRAAGSASPLKRDPDLHSSYARAEAAVRAARALTYEVAEAAWNEAEYAGELSARTSADVRLAALDAVHRTAAAIDPLYERAGMTPLFTASAFGRAWRDAHAVTQNMAVSARLYADVGATLLGA